MGLGAPSGPWHAEAWSGAARTRLRRRGRRIAASPVSVPATVIASPRSRYRKGDAVTSHRRAVALPLRLTRHALAVALAEEPLPQSDAQRRDLDQLVVLDILQRAFQRQHPRRLEVHV